MTQNYALPEVSRATLNAQRSTLNAQRSTLNAQRSTLNAQRDNSSLYSYFIFSYYLFYCCWRSVVMKPT